MTSAEGTRSTRVAVRWAVAGLAMHVALAGVFLASYHGNPQIFVHFGTSSCVLGFARDIFGSDLLVPNADGQDGQSYWILARDPLLLDGRTVIAPVLDRSGYRAQRMAYPALAAPWRLGGEYALLWGLLLTNLAVVFAGTWVTALLALDLGAPARASLAFALCPAVILSTVLDVADALTLAALLAALLALRRGRSGWAIAAATLAVLAKEPTLLGLVGVALFSTETPLSYVVRRRTRWQIVAVPLAAAIAWGLYARWRLGWPAASVEEFTMPFYGYIDAYQRGWSQAGNWADAAFAIALIPLGIYVVVRWWGRRNLLMSAALLFVAPVPFFSAQVIDLMLNPMRALGPVFTLLCLDMLVAAGNDGHRGAEPESGNSRDHP